MGSRSSDSPGMADPVKMQTDAYPAVDTSIRRIRGVDYLYFSYRGRGGNGRRAKHRRCGVAGTEESEKTCAEYMRSYLEGRSVDILGELQEVQARLGELDAQSRRRNKKRRAAPSARAKNFDARQLAKSIRIAEPEIHYKSSTHMDEVDSGSVHLIVTSPPYNVGKGYADYNDGMEFGAYLGFLNDVWTECVRVLCDGGRIAINVADTWRTPYIPLHSHTTQQLLGLGMLMRGVIYWDKGTSAGTSTAWGSWRSASNPTLRDVGEYILVFSKGNFKMRGKSRVSTITPYEFTQYTKSLWSFPTASAKREGHPAPFPDELPARLIKLYTFLGDTVLDPFLGSGTTARAAAALGRRAIGYEVDGTYEPLIRKKAGGISRIRIPLGSFFVNGTKPQELDAIYPPSPPPLPANPRRKK